MVSSPISTATRVIRNDTRCCKCLVPSSPAWNATSRWMVSAHLRGCLVLTDDSSHVDALILGRVWSGMPFGLPVGLGHARNLDAQQVLACGSTYGNYDPSEIEISPFLGTLVLQNQYEKINLLSPDQSENLVGAFHPSRDKSWVRDVGCHHGVG